MSRIREHGSDVPPAFPDQHGTAASTPAEWSLWSFLELGALPGAVPCARLHARHVLWEWGLAALTESVELVVSELVTNGVRALAAIAGSRPRGQWVDGVPPVRLWLSSDKNSVLVQVWDESERLPTRREVDTEAVSGRGLLLVEAVSAAWGTCAPECSVGKIVWALVEG